MYWACTKWACTKWARNGKWEVGMRTHLCLSASSADMRCTYDGHNCHTQTPPYVRAAPNHTHLCLSVSPADMRCTYDGHDCQREHHHVRAVLNHTHLCLSASPADMRCTELSFTNTTTPSGMVLMLRGRSRARAKSHPALQLLCVTQLCVLQLQMLQMLCVIQFCCYKCCVLHNFVATIVLCYTISNVVCYTILILHMLCVIQLQMLSHSPAMIRAGVVYTTASLKLRSILYVHLKADCPLQYLSSYVASYMYTSRLTALCSIFKATLHLICTPQG